MNVHNTYLPDVVWQFAKKTGIGVTETFIKNMVTEHPYYPSLYSISDVFERLNISSNAYRIDSEKITELNIPFIGYLKNLPTGNDFALITSVSEDHVKFVTDGSKEKTISKKSFENIWGNIALEATFDENSGDPNYNTTVSKERTVERKKQTVIFATCCAVILLISFFLYAVPSGLLSHMSLL